MKKEPESSKQRARVVPRDSGVQSLTRALNLLEELSKSEFGLSLTETSENVGLAASTTHRLLNSLKQSGFAEYDEQYGVWSVGLRAFTIGNTYLKSRDFVYRARPIMKELVEKTGETANLAIMVDWEAVFISQVECSEVMRMVAQLGSRSPLYASGVGKSLLSALPNNKALEYISSSKLDALTDNTITDPTVLLAEIKSIISAGYAIDYEEQKLGLRCIATNIYNHYGEALAALSISGPAARITDSRIPELGDLVVEIADEVTSAIGGKKPSSA